MSDELGMVYIFVGDGKGKTSAALGSAMRMLLLEKRVEWISWFKSSKWQISESKLPLHFKNNLRMYWAGEGFFIKGGEVEKRGTRLVKSAMANGSLVFDTTTPEAHRKAAKEALLLASKILARTNPPDLLVLDELIQAVNENLLSEREVITLIKNRRETHLVLTGHICPKTIEKMADLVTNMRKIKHPYDKGILAVRGLDF